MVNMKSMKIRLRYRQRTKTNQGKGKYFKIIDHVSPYENLNDNELNLF